MGLFDFLKPKPNKNNQVMARMHADIFPKGRKDEIAIVDELLKILDNKVDRTEAEHISFKTIAISYMSETLSKEDLISHLAGYCLEKFTDKQVASFHNYLLSIRAARRFNNRTPSEVYKSGDFYYW